MGGGWGGGVHKYCPFRTVFVRKWVRQPVRIALHADQNITSIDMQFPSKESKKKKLKNLIFLKNGISFQSTLKFNKISISSISESKLLSLSSSNYFFINLS